MPSARLRTLLSGALDFLLPRECPLCGDRLRLGSPRAVCQPCLDALERLEPPWCPCCGKPFESEIALRDSPGHLCAACREAPPAFDLARAAGPMEGQLRELIHLYKFGGRAGIASELGQLLGRLAEEEMGGWLEEGARVTHVPISPARWRERGFDQSELLARKTAGRLGLPFEPLLERRRDASPQTGLRGRERRRNLRGVFGLRSEKRLDGARVLLVDDVLTTGSTASACAHALKGAGAEAVAVLTVCTVSAGKWIRND
ncbi:MAG: ComF family protein [Candidatus Tectomicrobia bacterium]|uniref:ComF family protein n=1 Tax=Tectimicrobiota bacterium TaxID=2528274 RepID=A0A932I1M0_UNCTE|nr:ComF family protein [Candidatus Tectomicrobia bacterium]